MSGVRAGSAAEELSDMRQIDFKVLGPLEAHADGQPIFVGGAKQRALLAMLLLHAGERVPRDRLIDALWGDRPPASAVNSVQIYVSGLRKALGDERLVTRNGGYGLVLEPGSLDLRRFEDLVREGRELLDQGNPAAARARLVSALALWRGPPLPELAETPEGRVEVDSLEELWLAALEERIDVDLELGESTSLVPELERLVRRHPYRERLRRQAMLALYRSGRQSDALDVYREGRRRFSEELGLEPGPELQQLERAILNHDPALAGKRTRTARKRLRGPVLVTVSAGLLLLVAVAVGFRLRGGREPALASVAPGSVGVVDAGSRRIVSETPLAGEPGRVASSGRAVWVGSDEARTLSEVVGAGVRKLVALGVFPSAIAAGKRSVWVYDGQSGRIEKVDPDYGVEATRRVMAPNAAYDTSREDFDPTSVAVGLGSVWLTTGSRRLIRIDPATARVVARVDLRQPLDGVAAGAGSVWALSGTGATVFRLDRRGKLLGRVQIVSEPGFESPYPVAIELGQGSVWVLNRNTATVTRIDPTQRTVTATIPLGIERAPVRMAVGAGAAWVADSDGTLARIDPTSNAVDFVSVAHRLNDVGIAGDRVWVSAGAGLSSAASPAVSAAGQIVEPLPSSYCSPMYYAGRGRPQYLIASDLPLQGQGTVPLQMSQAIEYLLRTHGFRAGRFAVGYQACDDSIAPGTASDKWFAAFLAKCAADARAYARNDSVIGVIGTYNSPCAEPEIPLTNGARHGPLAMISPTNTYVGLTRGGPGTAPGEPNRFYPTHIRNYVRVIAADDFQGAADAVLARQLGAKKVYAVYEQSDYGVGIAAAFRLAAAKLGLEVVGSREWKGGVVDTRALANAVLRRGAQAVFLGAYLGEPNSGTLVRDLRMVLGPRARIIAPDGFSDFGKLISLAGSAAEGMTVSVAGVPTARLPEAGRRFVAAFGEAVGETPSPSSVYAAQAAQVLLDAIARSDGTRASVTEALFKAKVSNGFLGSFTFDRNGDPTVSAVTIYRIERGKARVFKVITPSRRLVR